MAHVSWIESGGGPLVAMHVSRVGSWRGIHGPHPTQGEHPVTSDYEQACAVDTEIGVLERPDANILVIGDEPNRTSVRVAGSAILIVRWQAAISESALEHDLSAYVADLNYEPCGLFCTVPGEHHVFDAAKAGWQHGASVGVHLESTRYDIRTALLVTDQTELLIHRLDPA